MITTLSTAFAYYSTHKAALFPIPAGAKNPTGIVQSFKHDWSRDPAQWERWYTEHQCNFGVVAFASNWIIIDIDVQAAGRDAAWSAWCALCHEWGIEPAQPHCQSARGGWHVYFSLPPDIDASTLRQPDAIKKLINVRCIGYTVAAGSYYDGTAKGEQSGHYVLLPDAPAPYPAPAALIQHCTRAAAPSTNAVSVGQRDPAEVESLVQWLNERNEFDDYSQWVALGMALKLELGDSGLPLWESVTWPEAKDLAASKWQSFSDTSTGDSVTLGTFLARAHQLGWKGRVGKSSAAMFGDAVAKIASDAGASLSLFGETQRIVAALGQDVLDNFLSNTEYGPQRSLASNYPTLPHDSMKDHPIYDLLCSIIERIVALSDTAATFRQDKVLRPLAVLHHAHATTADALVQFITNRGCTVSPSKYDSEVKRFEREVRTDFNTKKGFIPDKSGKPDPQLTDNIYCFLRETNTTLRFDDWRGKPEIMRDGEYGSLSDDDVTDLHQLARSADFNFNVAKEFLRDGILTTARKSRYDPLCEMLDTLAEQWDRTPRLLTWLSITCGVPCDLYHQTVGKTLIGGMIKRAREPGCVFDETVIFISPKQRTGKSSLTKELALKSEWHTASFKFEGSPQNYLPQLDGKWIIELSELAGLAQKEVEHVKSFLTNTTDTYTRKYEAFARDHARRCIFIGTTNEKKPLRDITGNRRFLPVHVKGLVNLDWLKVNKLQLIGEAAFLHSHGEDFSIPLATWEVVTEHQEEARSKGPIEDLCYDWFDRDGPVYITATDVQRAFRMAGQSPRTHYGTFMEKMGWRDVTLKIPETARRGRVWLKAETNRLETCTRMIPVQQQQNGPVEMRLRTR